MAAAHLAAKLVEVMEQKADEASTQMEVDCKRVRGGGHVQFDQSAVLPTAPYTVHCPSAVKPTRLTYPASQPRLLHHRHGYMHVSQATAAPLLS
jgi:hypothetical protein